jgi:serine/threonine-protein kinase
MRALSPRLLSSLPLRRQPVGGRYRVEQILQTEPDQTLVSARDEREQRQVAIRFSTRASSVPAPARERFRTEARASCRLHHPHLARVLDVGETPDGIPYVVSEPVAGCPLDVMLSSGTVTAADAVVWVRQACDGLSAAHSLGLVHHDLTLTGLSVVRSHEGTLIARLNDLGASALLDSAVDAPHDSPSLAYRAPERGRCGAVESVAGNVWSLGVILYELLTGAVPFAPDATGALTHGPGRARPPPPRSLRQGISPSLEAAVLGCLAPRPTERIASTAALARELSSYASRRPEPSYASERCRPGAPGLRNRRRRVRVL